MTTDDMALLREFNTVAFFKQAISSPLDVGSFIAGERNLRPIEEPVQKDQLVAQKIAFPSDGSTVPRGVRQWLILRVD